MLAKITLLTAFACNAWASPKPKDLNTTWHTNDYSALRQDMPLDVIRWEFTLEGRNGVPISGPVSTKCLGYQPVFQPNGELPEFQPCSDKAYEARQYWAGTGDEKTLEVRRFIRPDGKQYIISATANFTTHGNVKNKKLTFGNFQKLFIEPPA
ncbi:hypothetical protein IL306_010630 [Fusarium sp. DS 682]|nr:hypothetical protein IL306_010630 [Fusarium sp. DS 682]